MMCGYECGYVCIVVVCACQRTGYGVGLSFYLYTGSQD